VTAARPASLRPTLPGPDYVDPAIFAREQERIFAPGWSALAIATDLPRPGDWVTAALAGEQLLIVRQTDGSVRGFHNVCRHRGSTICDGPAGSAGRMLRCPYHAWTYDLEGSFVGAPQLRAMPDVDRAGQGLVPVGTEVWSGLVWVTLDPLAPPVADTVGREIAERLGGPAAIDAWGMDRLVSGARRTYQVTANWKLLVENFMECYHCATIHPELTRTLPEFRTGLGTQNSELGAAVFAPDVEAFSLSGEHRHPRLPGLDETHERQYRGMTLRPLTLLNLLPDHVIVHRIVPLAPDRTVVHCDWLFDPDVVAAPGFDPDDTVALFDAVNRQDFEACERCQGNMGSVAFARGGVLVPSEHHLEAFHDWVRDALR
jgi:Rieske 2Fe-2S family protein